MENQGGQEYNINPSSEIQWKIVDQVVIPNIAISDLGKKVRARSEQPYDSCISRWEGVINGRVRYSLFTEDRSVEKKTNSPEQLWAEIQPQMERFIKLDPDKAKEIRDRFRRNRLTHEEVCNFGKYLRQEHLKKEFEKRKLQIINKGK